MAASRAKRPFTDESKGLSFLLIPMDLATVGHLVRQLLAERRRDLIQHRHDAGLWSRSCAAGRCSSTSRPTHRSALRDVRSRSP